MQLSVWCPCEINQDVLVLVLLGVPQVVTKSDIVGHPCAWKLPESDWSKPLSRYQGTSESSWLLCSVTECQVCHIVRLLRMEE